MSDREREREKGKSKQEINYKTIIDHRPLITPTINQSQQVASTLVEMSLEEYQSQLLDIETLLADAPEDESLLTLKSDLLELIQLTAGQDTTTTTTTNSTTTRTRNVTEQEYGDANDNTDSLEKMTSESATATSAAAAATAADKPKKQKKFEIPEHLLPLESDTEAQRNKKKRTVKTLKSKHNAAQKEYESSKKQSAWLDFSKKKRKKGKTAGDSIFKTADGDGKVGVVNAASSASASASAAAASSSSSNNKRQRHMF